MSRRDTIQTLFAGKLLGAPNTGPEADKDRIRTGAVSAMGVSLQQMSEEARSASRLQEKLLAGDTVVELDPADLDPSMVQDRLATENDPIFETFVANIADNGQRTPILVRPHPLSPGRYQIAFGHRRVRAALRLGRKVKAVVQSLSDSDLVIAQGNENLERQDLSYIEKSRFALSLEKLGFERSVIMSALGTEKADLSRYLAIAKQIPAAVLEAIGPAPKVGRARWLGLAGHLDGLSEKTTKKISSTDHFRTADSDTRFAIFMAAVGQKAPEPPKPTVWTTRDGRRAGAIKRAANRTVLTIDETLVPEFGEFLAASLDRLFAEFQNTHAPSPGSEEAQHQAS